MTRICYKARTAQPLILFARTEMNGAVGTKHSPDKVPRVSLPADADCEIGLSISGLSEPTGFSKQIAAFEGDLRV